MSFSFVEYQSRIFRSEGGKSKTIHKYELYVVLLDISFLQLMYLNMNGEDYIIRHNIKNGIFSQPA